ncbi:dienelactone hydrolase family protein [Alphaproteobacteria bacterium]|nr:dienelactone hydrolase family protein [Alphaproteobacteria bacterium]MDC1023266.1 dienelactone hydrolase family protein [Alphaproteobacteria bacterium]
MNSFLELTASDNHKFSAYLAQPPEKPKAGLVILQEIFGVNTHIQELADFFSKKGYLSIAPSLFDRAETNVQLSYDEIGVSKGRKLKDLCDDKVLVDIEASVSLVSSAGKVGVIGYCWGGSLAWKFACQSNQLSGSVSYYGGDIPNLKNYDTKCSFLCHFGELDKGIPIEKVDVFKEFKPEVQVFTYPADHGFNCNHRKNYNETSAKVALDRTLKFLEDNLG